MSLESWAVPISFKGSKKAFCTRLESYLAQLSRLKREEKVRDENQKNRCNDHPFIGYCFLDTKSIVSQGQIECAASAGRARVGRENVFARRRKGDKRYDADSRARVSTDARLRKYAATPSLSRHGYSEPPRSDRYAKSVYESQSSSQSLSIVVCRVPQMAQKR